MYPLSYRWRLGPFYFIYDLCHFGLGPQIYSWEEDGGSLNFEFDFTFITIGVEFGGTRMDEDHVCP